MRILILKLSVIILFGGCGLKLTLDKELEPSPTLNKISCKKAESMYAVLIEKYKVIDDKFLNVISGKNIKTASISDLEKGIKIFTEYEAVGKNLIRYCEGSIVNSSIWYGSSLTKVNLLYELDRRVSH